MKSTNLKRIVFVSLSLVWAASILVVIAPKIGLVTPIFPRPSPDYSLILMIAAAILLAGYSLKQGIEVLRN